MKINRIWIILVLLAISACNNQKTGWKTIELGRYLLDVPKSFAFKYQNGIDSEGGEITNDTITFNTNFGYYTDTLFQTPQEYLNHRRSIFDAEDQFMKPNIIYDNNNRPRIEVISIRPSISQDSDRKHFFAGSDYIAICKHDNKIFYWPIRLPADIKHHTIQIDTFNCLYRRIALPNKGFIGETAVYMRANKNVDRQYAIVISTNSLTSKQQILALKIFKTLRPNPVPGKVENE